jgi:hypothetical protein
MSYFNTEDLENLFRKKNNKILSNYFNSLILKIDSEFNNNILYEINNYTPNYISNFNHTSNSILSIKIIERGNFITKWFYKKISFNEINSIIINSIHNNKYSKNIKIVKIVKNRMEFSFSYEEESKLNLYKIYQKLDIF